MLVSVAPAFPADVEIKQLTRLSCRLADMAAAARFCLHRGIDDLLMFGSEALSVPPKAVPAGVPGLTLVDVDARGANRVVKKHFAQVAFRLRCLITPVHSAIG